MRKFKMFFVVVVFLMSFTSFVFAKFTPDVIARKGQSDGQQMQDTIYCKGIAENETGIDDPDNFIIIKDIDEQRLENHEKSIEGIDEQITISAGVSTLLGDDTQPFDQLVQSAIQALKKAKMDGKNKIVT